MATFTKTILSGSIDGKSILLTSTDSASGNFIHAPLSGTGSMDEVWVYAYNEATDSIVASINWGDTIEPDNVVRAAIPSQSGRILIIDGRLITNGLTISAYAAVANWVTIDGFINRIS